MDPTSKLSYIEHETLNACADLAHAFLCRDIAIDVAVPKMDAIERLADTYRRGTEHLGFAWEQLQTAEQTHGTGLAIVTQPLGGLEALPVVDGLLTNTPGVLLAIMVADCCAISVVDPAKKALALLHSGKCGSEANILGKAITEMANHFDSPPQDLIVQLSPCIRPPHYEIDFAATIRAQAADAGVPSEQIHDEQICTASDPDRFYSYRREKGLTGRMLALLGYR